MKLSDNIFWYQEDPLITRFFGRGFTCGVYAILQNNETWLIEAGTHKWGIFRRLLRRMKRDGLEPNKITKIFITHIHPDHVGALPDLQSLCKCKIIIPEPNAYILKEGNDTFWETQVLAAQGYQDDFMKIPYKLVKWVTNFKMGKIPQISGFQTFKEGEIFPGNPISLLVLSTPGHSPDHSSFYAEKQQILFAGDIFGMYFPNKPVINLPTSNFDAYLNSLEQLSNLSVRHLYPTHTPEIHEFSPLDFYEYCKKTIDHLRLAEKIVLKHLHSHISVQITDFLGKFPEAIWIKQEHGTLAWSILQSLQARGIIDREKNKFILKKKKLVKNTLR